MGRENQFTKKLSQDNFVRHIYLDTQPFAPKHLSLRDMVVTPDRVPKFTIPPLCQSRRPCLLQTPSGREDTEFGSSRRHTMPWLTLSSLRDRQVKSDARADFLSQFSDYISADPATRAAMSLPHLTKITTPYGFLALGESPCVPRRESLFFECHAQNMCATENRKGLRHPGHPALRRQSYSLTDIGNIPHEVRTPARSMSCYAASGPRCATGQAENLPLTSYRLTDSYHPSPVQPGSPGKGRLKYILKKQLAAVRALCPCSKRDIPKCVLATPRDIQWIINEILYCTDELICI